METSNALNCRVWAIPAVLSKGIPGNDLRAKFRGLSGILREFLPEGPSRTGGVAHSKEKPYNQERKISPKRKFFGTDIPRTSGGHSRGYPGPKLRSGRSKSWKNKHLDADIHGPKARTSKTLKDFQKLRSEKLWAEFSFPIQEIHERRAVGWSAGRHVDHPCVSYFRRPPTGRPTHGVPKPPSNKKKKSQNPENPAYPQK